MLRFLNIFKKKEREAATVTSDELAGWFHAKVEERVLEMDGAVQALYTTVDQLRDMLRNQHHHLRAAAIIEEDKIEARVKSIVLGHRENYCRELSLFLNNIEIPMETHIDHGIKLNNDLKYALDAFAQQTHKSFLATQHLFHREVEAIAATLRDLSSATRSFDELLGRKGIPALETIRKQIELLKKETTKKSRLQQDMHIKKGRLESALKNKETKTSEISALHESSEFKDYQAMLEKRALLVDRCAAIEREVTGLFLELERAFRKYEYSALGTKQKLVQHYLQDPKEALRDDHTLAVCDILVELKGEISTLGLKEEQQQKLAEILSQQSREKLADLRNRYISLLDERELMRKHIENNSAIARIKEKEYKLNHFEEQARRFEKEVEQLHDELEQIRVEESGRKIAEEISSALGVELQVVFAD
ncbi:hypothetical protein HY497_01520 [Candidatus Woesearchaeota archaeon]|nr:hypothetical protein [Candidatus Woesearchaeota archaeon]